jgi:hypothetical protein
MKTPTLPTIHLNGTSDVMLLEHYIRARSALIDARDAIASIEFHARDYYPQGSGAWLIAMRERKEVFDKINEVDRYLDAHIEHIANLTLIR